MSFCLCLVEVLGVGEVSNPVDDRTLKVVQSVNGLYSSVCTRIFYF